jgi:predicted dehydrogenase
MKVTADDTALISFRLENGASGHIAISIAARGGPRRMELYGTKGSLFLEGTSLYQVRDGQTEEVEILPHEQGRLEDARLGPFVELAQRVVDRVNGKDSGAFPTFEDGVRVQRVMDAVHLSADERREVKLSEI